MNMIITIMANTVRVFAERGACPHLVHDCALNRIASDDLRRWRPVENKKNDFHVLRLDI